MKFLPLAFLTLIGCYSPTEHVQQSDLLPDRSYAVTAVEVAGNCGSLPVARFKSDSEGHLVMPGCVTTGAVYDGGTVSVSDMKCVTSDVTLFQSGTLLISEDGTSAHGFELFSITAPFRCASRYEVWYNLEMEVGQ